MTIEQKVIDAFKKKNFDITEVKGNSRHGEHMVAIWHDGVQYAVDYHGHLDSKNNPDIDHGAKHLKIMIESEVYHTKIKQIYDYLMKQNIGDIWVMAGGGMQVQAFFGNKSGYVGMLYLEMDNIKKPKEKEHTLVVNGEKNDKYFNGKVSKFEQLGVELRLCRDVYGKDEDYDEDYDEIYNN